MNIEARKRLDSILNEWVLDQENPKLNLQLAEVYRELNQPAAAFAHYMKLYEMLDPSKDFELRYYCIMSICEIYWHTGNRLKGVIHHARLAKAEQPDRPEAYFMLANTYREMCLRDKVKHCYDWIQVYENAKIGLMFAEAGKDRDNSKFYIGIDYLRYLYILGAIKSCKLMEAKRFINDINPENLEPWARARVYDLYQALGMRYPILTYDKERDGEIDLQIDRNYAMSMQDIFVLRTLNNKRDGKYIDITGTKPTDGSCTYLLEKLGWTGQCILSNVNLANEYSETRTAKLKFVDLNGYGLVDLIKESVDYINIDLGGVDDNIKALYRIPFDDYDAKIITIKDYEAFKNQSKAMEIVKFLKNKGYYMVAHVAFDGEHQTDAWYINSKYFSKELIMSMMARYSSCDSVKSILL